MSLIKRMLAMAGMAFLALPVVPEASAGGAQRSQEHTGGQGMAIPSTVQAEHQEIHAQLAQVLKAGGKTGAAAGDLAKLLEPHFLKEEQLALPPLGLLEALAAGKAVSDPQRVIEMTDRLKAEMPGMLREHKDIGGAVQRLRSAARDEGKQDALQFAERLSAHAKQEEQVMYPSAIMVGEFLKLKR